MTLLSSKTVIEEVEPRVVGIDSTQITRPAFLGITERGPVGTPTLVTSFDEYQRVFGGFVTDGYVAQAVQTFFGERGSQCYVVRTVHYTDTGDPSTKTSAAATLDLETATSVQTAATVTGTTVEPFSLTPGATLSVDVDGGAPQVATFDAAAASLTSGSAEPFALADGQTLEGEIDGVAFLPITFLAAEFANIAAATAQEVSDVINAKLAGAFSQDSAGNVVLTSDTKGTASSVHITGGTANVALGFSTTQVDGTGDVADITAVTAAEVETVVEADVTGIDVIPQLGGQVQFRSLITGALSSLQFAAGSVQIAMGLVTATVSGGTGAPAPTLRVTGRYDGSYANALTVRVSAASNGDADRFNLTVLEDGVVVSGGTFANLSMDATDSRYVETVVNADPVRGGSRLIVVEDLELAAVDTRPADGTFGPMTGGDDGLVGLVDGDFVGASTDFGRTGLRTLDVVLDSELLALPGQVTATIHNAMITYCEITRSGRMFCVIDPPEGLTAQEVRTYAKTTAGLVGLSQYGALYWPWPLISNPSEPVFGQAATITVPPSGHVVGICARTDASRSGGIYVPPAGNNDTGRLLTAVGLETDQVNDEAVRDLIYPDLINPINQPVGGGRPYINGSRTLRSGGNFPYVNQRRGAIFIKSRVDQGMEPVRHQPNTPALRRAVDKILSQFLESQMRIGAFASENPEEAFFVDVSEALNPPSSVNDGNLRADIGIAPTTPAEFIIIRLSSLRTSLEEELGL